MPVYCRRFLSLDQVLIHEIRETTFTLLAYFFAYQTQTFCPSSAAVARVKSHFSIEKDIIESQYHTTPAGEIYRGSHQKLFNK